VKCRVCHKGLFVVIEGRHRPLAYDKKGFLCHQECLDKLKARKLEMARKQMEETKQKERQKLIADFVRSF
jgi:hypothetical protein